ncbi:MAG: hypothetical protein Q8M98_08455 [Candidatus Cloacimonadaceae bacterium]|nr:hypothetical protein [Candidatus Cloacimonadaceae bacterium]MDP3114793.1 hypothetical protein [Candidatus Cloacimonadaceae bacterium]
MINEKIESFLEKTDMNYLYCLLAKLEAQRLSQFPSYVKNRFTDKIPIIAMKHVADNEVPDYLSELAEAELAMAQAALQVSDEDLSDVDLSEETIDDSVKFIQELKKDNLENYSDDDDDDFFFEQGDAEDSEDI